MPECKHREVIWLGSSSSRRAAVNFFSFGVALMGISPSLMSPALGKFLPEALPDQAEEEEQESVSLVVKVLHRRVSYPFSSL